MEKQFSTTKKRPKCQTFTADDATYDAMDLLRERGFNISKLIRDFIKSRAEELKNTTI